MYFIGLSNWINHYIAQYSINEIYIISALLTAFSTLLIGFFAVKMTFLHLRTQLEHKIILAGWKEVQDKLFNFSRSFSDYSSKLSSLKYFVEWQDDTFINDGDKSSYVTDN